MKSKKTKYLLLASLSALGLTGTLWLLPAGAANYQAPIAGSYVMRLVSPLPGSENTVDLTSDAKGSWDQFYGKGLRALSMYADVRSEVNLTFKYTTPAGAPITNKTVYLVVNKKFSCSKTTFYTTQNTDYPGHNRSDTHSILRDWCGDQPQMGAGETSIIATTDAFGKATFNLKNYSITGEQFPKALNQTNQYSAGISCGDDTMCMQTTLAPSMVAHPNEAYERTEDKDLIFLHFVNPKVTPAAAKYTVKPGTTKTLTFKLTNLTGQPVAGTTVTFDSWGEGDALPIWSAISNAKGEVSVKVTAPKGTVGLQVVRAFVYGSPKGTDLKVYWK